MVMNVRYLLVVFILIFHLNGFAQISSVANYSEATEYSDSDFVFVFCTENENGGSLIANDSTGFGGYNFEWYKFNETTKDFTDLLTGFSINSDSTQSTISNLATGGYKVILTNADTIQQYVAWVFNNTGRSVEINIKDNDCDFLWMETDPYYQRDQKFNTNLTYYDTITDASFVFKNSVQYEWSSSPEEDDFRKNNAPYASIGDNIFDTDKESELPTENTVFSVIVTDRFGCVVQDDIDYTAIETDTDFSWQVLDDKTGAEISSGDREADLSGTAPMYVKFTNNSLNAKDFIIFFGDTLQDNDIDTIFTSDILLEPEHVYYYTIPDSGKTYVARFYSISEYGCKDSLLLNIKVDPSSIEFPNVFTPNNDAVNDVFIATDFKSIRSFKITIFNRAGQLVHEYDGDVRDWEGWDGNIKNSNREAPAGNYFFVVEVKGWDGVNYDNKSLANKTSSTNNTEGGNTGSDSASNTMFGVLRLFR